MSWPASHSPQDNAEFEDICSQIASKLLKVSLQIGFGQRISLLELAPARGIELLNDKDEDMRRRKVQNEEQDRTFLFIRIPCWVAMLN